MHASNTEEREIMSWEGECIIPVKPSYGTLHCNTNDSQGENH